MADALGKRKVVERRVQLQNVPVDFDDFIDVARVMGVSDAQQAYLIGRHLRVLEPGSPEEVAATHSKA
jgi:hypothetical protein